MWIWATAQHGAPATTRCDLTVDRMLAWPDGCAWWRRSLHEVKATLPAG